MLLKTKSPYTYLYLGAIVFLVSSFFLFKDLPFFWDAISKSYRAHWIYDNHFEHLILPTEIGSGHPSLWPILLALFWTIFGKSLLAVRFLLLLVNIGVAFQILAFFKTILKISVSPFFVLFVFLDPTLLAQTTSLNNDMLLLFFSLWSLNSVLKQQKGYLFLALTGALFTNLRGIYVFLALAIIQYAYFKYRLLKTNKKLWLPFMFSAVVFFIYCCVHYIKLGWVIITPNPAYSDHRNAAPLKNIAINMIVYVKNFMEYGRVIVYAILGLLIIIYWKFKTHKNNPEQRTFLLIVIPILAFGAIFFLGMVPFTNPIGTRYFMIVFILLMCLFIYLMHQVKPKFSKLLYGAVIVALISGHFWVYPATLSQSWDSSLCYINYYSIEEKMEHYLDDHSIKKNNIGTRVRLNERAFANLIDLKNNDYYSKFDLDSNAYILLSNIENYTKDDELLYVINNWKHIKTFKKLGVFLSLYQRQ